MSSLVQDKHLNKDENCFLVKYFKDTKNYDDMFVVLSKIINSKQFITYKEYAFYSDCIMSYCFEKQEFIKKLRVLEEKERKNNPSYAGYVKELLVIAEEEFKRKINEVKDEVEKRILSSVSNETKVLVLLLLIELLFAVYSVDNSVGYRNLQSSIEECYKLAATILKPYSRDFLKTILAMGNFYYKVLKDADFAKSFLEESYSNALMYSNNSSDEDAIVTLKENKDLLVIIKNNLIIYSENTET